MRELEATYRELLAELTARELPFTKSQTYRWLDRLPAATCQDEIEDLADRWEQAFLQPEEHPVANWIYKCNVDGYWLEWPGDGPWAPSPETVEQWGKEAAEMKAGLLTSAVERLFKRGPAYGYPHAQVRGIIDREFAPSEWLENFPAAWSEPRDNSGIVH